MRTPSPRDVRPAEGRAKERRLIREHFQQLSEDEDGGGGGGGGGDSDAGGSSDEAAGFSDEEGDEVGCCTDSVPNSHGKIQQGYLSIYWSSYFISLGIR